MSPTAFISTLRVYEKTRSPSFFGQTGQTDYFGWAQTARLGKDFREEQTKSQVIKEVTRRLSPAKLLPEFRLKSPSRAGSIQSPGRGSSIKDLKEKVGYKGEGKMMMTGYKVKSPVKLLQNEYFVGEIGDRQAERRGTLQMSERSPRVRVGRHKKNGSAVILAPIVDGRMGLSPSPRVGMSSGLKF